MSTAEQAYLTALKEAEKREDRDTLSVLEGLSQELDQLKEFKKRDIAAYAATVEEDEDEDDDGFVDEGIFSGEEDQDDN